MAGQLIPPPELAPPFLKNLTPGQRIELWADLVDAGEELFLARLRRELGSEGDVRAAYRRWYADQMKEHDRALKHMLQELHRREGSHAR